MQVARVFFGQHAQTAIHHHSGYWIRIDAFAKFGSYDVVEVLHHEAEVRLALVEADVPTLVRESMALPEAAARFASPLVGPRSIFAVGLNYHAHADEVGEKGRESPLLFAKWSSSLSGPNDPIPLDVSLSGQIDYEVELAVIIGWRCKDVAPKDALAHVGGYMVANDVSARDLQFADGQWTRAKSFDGFCPTGPWVTTREDVVDPQDLKITCSVNGEIRQEAHTSQMVHRIDELISFAARGTTLFPGDILLTGTPAGVAMGMGTPRWLQVGDVVRSEVQGLGCLDNRVIQR